jgi:hypothetical protein
VSTKRFLVFLVILVLLASITVPALAKKPDKYSDSFPQSFPVASCDGFDVMLEGMLNVDVTVYYDNDGNEDRTKLHLTSNDRYYTIPDMGKEAWGPITINVFLEAGETKAAGVNAKLTIPGEGTILIDAGQIKIDADDNIVFLKGNHQLMEGDFDKLCTWFAEP